MTESQPTLTDTNQQCHAQIKPMLVDCLERLTDCQFDAALQSFTQFRDKLLKHLEREEALILPCVAAQDIGEAAQARQIEGDHQVLQRQLRNCHAQLEELNAHANASRRDMLEVLPTLFRLKSVLEHHDERERTQLYPSLSSTLSSEQEVELCRQLQE